METEAAPALAPPVRRPRVRVALRVGVAQVLLIIGGMIFIRRDVYLQGNVSSLLLHWQETWVCGAMFVDGIIRGAYGLGPYISPFRKRILRFGLPAALFFYSSCATLCIKLHVATLDYEWARDIGVAILGVALVINLLLSLRLPVFVRGAEASMVMTARDKDEFEVDETNDSPIAINEPAEAASGEAASANEPSQIATSIKPDITTNENVKLEPAEKFEVLGIWKYLRYPDRFAILLMLSGLSLAMGAWMPLLALPGLFVAFKWEIGDLESYRTSQFGEAYLNYRKTSWALLPFIY